MRLLILLVAVGALAASGCGGPRDEVRVYSSVPIESPQQRLDGVASGFLDRLFGGCL